MSLKKSSIPKVIWIEHEIMLPLNLQEQRCINCKKVIIHQSPGPCFPIPAGKIWCVGTEADTMIVSVRKPEESVIKRCIE